MSDWKCNFEPQKGRKYYELKPSDELCVNTNSKQHYRIEVKSKADAESKLKKLAGKALKEEAWLYVEAKLKNGKIVRYLYEDGITENQTETYLDYKVLNNVLKLGKTLELVDYHIHPSQNCGLPDLPSWEDTNIATKRQSYLEKRGFGDIPYESMVVSEKQAEKIVPNPPQLFTIEVFRPEIMRFCQD